MFTYSILLLGHELMIVPLRCKGACSNKEVLQPRHRNPDPDSSK